MVELLPTVDYVFILSDFNVDMIKNTVMGFSCAGGYATVQSAAKALVNECCATVILSIQYCNSALSLKINAYTERCLGTR
ncbi:hypothetical protein evm_006020 [Chilo suppressalis]|nr:hypothetical protein evm_006020 [Chilo suppressalis]